LKGQNEELLGVIQSSEEEIERLETEVRNVKSSSKIELSKTKIENNKLKSSIEELENKVESLNSIEQENNELRSSLESLEDKDKIIDDLQNNNKELKSSLESVKDELSKMNQKDKEIELLQRENGILKRENEELQASINDLAQGEVKVIPTDQIQPSGEEEKEKENKNNDNDNNLSISSSSISLFKCSTPDLIKEIKDLKKCVYYINKQKKELEKKLEDVANKDNNDNNNNNNNNNIINNSNNNNKNDNNVSGETLSLQELQGVIEGIDKEIMSTRKIKAQFDEQENSIIDLKRELLKYSKNKEERVRNISKALNNELSNINNNEANNNYNNNNIKIKSEKPDRSEKNIKANTLEEENNSMDNILFKVQLQNNQNNKAKLQNQLCNAKKTIHQLKKLCDSLSTELETYRNSNEREPLSTYSIDINNRQPNLKHHSHSHSRNRTNDKRSSSISRNLGMSNNNDLKNNCNYYININDNAPSVISGSNSTSVNSSTGKNFNNIYDTMSYSSGTHGYNDNSDLMSESSIITSSIPKEKPTHSRRSQSTSRYGSKYYDNNNNNTDIMMLINERDKEREHRLNRDLNSLQNKFQDLLKSYQNIKSERDLISNELINSSNKNDRNRHSHTHSRHRKPSDIYDSAITRGRSESPSKKTNRNDKGNIGNGHLRSCSTHTNGIKVEVYT